MGDMMDSNDVESLLNRFFKLKAYVYIRKKHGNNLIRHYNGIILEYNLYDKDIVFEDDEIPSPIRIDKRDIVFVDYSRKKRRVKEW